jgi:hypothetical protein
MRASRAAGPSHGLVAVCGALLALACLIGALATAAGPLVSRSVHVAAASSRPSPLLPAAEDAPCEVAPEDAAPPLVRIAFTLPPVPTAARPAFLPVRDIRPPADPTLTSLAERGPPAVAAVRS